MTDQNATVAYPNGDVIVSRPEVRKYMNQVSATQTSSIMRFLIAHELTHLVQFELYHYEPNTADAQTHRVMESQADISAGLSLFLSLDASERNEDKILDALRYVFALGD